MSVNKPQQWTLFCFKAHANGRNKSQHCCVLLEVFGQQCCVRLHGPKSLTGFKLYATSANIVVVPCKWTQQVGPDNVACVVGQQCCVRLHGSLCAILNVSAGSVAVHLHFNTFMFCARSRPTNKRDRE